MAAAWADFTLDPAIAAWGDEQQGVWEQGLQDEAPVGRGPTAGEFRDGITATVSGGGRQIDCEGDDPPASYLLNGTAAHGPVTAQALRFEIDGQLFYRKWVSGIAPNDFVDRTVDAHGDDAVESLLDQIAESWSTEG